MSDWYTSQFAGFPVVEWREGSTGNYDPEKTIFALHFWDEEDDYNVDLLDKFISDPKTDKIAGLVFRSDDGFFPEPLPNELLDILVSAQDKFVNFRAFYMWDVPFSEEEVAVIPQGNISRVLTVFPDLEHLKIRGFNGLGLGASIEHDHLISLEIENWEFERHLVRIIGAAKLPALEKLSLWLGGGDEYWEMIHTRIEDLRDFHHCDGCPNLKHLGLCNSIITDEIADFLATAPVIARLDTLDLSLGTLGDEGAKALLASPHIRQLKKLDVSHNYCSPEMVAELEALSQYGVTVDASDQREEYEDSHQARAPLNPE